ncbi:28 kDa ribonucleoprotein, chloroplastic [Cucurbita moschata]|uniref:28 kDa ribonucleoprotein, chloroplastic n=1 Tax=Cucurbita moschata TaxID=3662 RepID=A0A6J1H6A5_CUCMO|nr:28 kDa ribonucleoprotein, chloroplastic [Cucurbita moschata]XP_022959558.1 28 kDa ribonucleoprotein, chloroplastic [Cucurbita moschata]
MANAASCLSSSSLSSSSRILGQKFHNCFPLKQLHSLPSSIHFDHWKLSRLVFVAPPMPCVSSSSSCSPRFLRHKHGARFPVIFTVLDQEAAITAEVIEEDGVKSEDSVSNQEVKNLARPCELYVCNLPRSCDIAELVEMFKPFGTVLAAEVSRNPETGISKGCGYVTMGSINSAKVSITALDCSDVGGREMRVRFAVDMNPKMRNRNNLHSSPRKNIIYESPYKIYIGNLAWDVKPEDLRNLFSQFGTVVSAKILNDRRAGKSRLYGFLSFSSAAERDAAISLNGTEFKNRKLIVKEGLERNES